LPPSRPWTARVRDGLVVNWPAKLTALLLSGVLWAAVAAEEPTTQLVPVTLVVQPPPGRTLKGTLPSVQAVYVPADDITDPGTAAAFSHLDAVAVLSRNLASQGLYPAVDPLTSASRLLTPRFVSEEHYRVARETREVLARYEELRDIIAILGIEELSDDERRTAVRARRLQRFLTQPLFATAQFTDIPGQFVPLDETVRGFSEILAGTHDALPEQAFYMVGTIDEVTRKARGLSDAARPPAATAPTAP